MFDIGSVKNTPVICDYNAVWHRPQLPECRQNHTISSSHRAAYCRSHAAASHHSASSSLPIRILRFVLFAVYITLHVAV